MAALLRPLAFAQAEAAEAEEAQREHRPGRWFGDGRDPWSECGRAMRHNEVQERGSPQFFEPDASAAGPINPRASPMQAAPSSESASKPPSRLAKPRMSKLSSVASVAAVGQVDCKAAVERRELADRKRSVLSKDVAGKIQAEHAAGGLGEIAGDGLRRRDLAARPCWSRSRRRRRRRHRRRAPYCR